MTRELPAHPAVVSVPWLAERIGETGLVIVDATVTGSPRPGGGVHWDSGIAGHRERRIPGAVFADVLHDFSEPHARLHFTAPTAARFESGARALGVEEDSSIVVYDAGNGAFAARLWWLFRAFGHERVAVLDGGLRAWEAAGASTTGGEQVREQGSFVAQEREGFFISKDRVLEVAEGAPGTLISALPPEDPRADVGFRGRAGRIPGTITVPAGSLIGETNTLLPEDGLRAAFRAADLSGGGPVVAYCGGGISASLAALALTHIGVDGVLVYDGSLNEWALDPAAPLVSTGS